MIEYHRDRTGHPLIVELEPERLKRLRELLKDSTSFSRAYYEISGRRYNGAPKATYDAVVYELRTYGLPQLSKLNCQRRLSDLSAAQVRAVMASLQARRKQYPNVSDDLLKALARIYSEKVNA